MNARRLFSLILVLTLLATLTAVAAAAPLAGPCVPGAVYDSGCDANHDGQITVADIQLTAGHWNQTGTFVSDSNHTHLGQTWTGANNPIKIQGAFGAPDPAPLVLSNSTGTGLRITSAMNNGVQVDSAGDVGVFVSSAGFHGVVVSSAGYAGVVVNSADHDGVVVSSAGYDGVHANTLQAGHEWGFSTPDKIYAGTALASNGPVMLVAQSGDSGRLETGDLVVVSGTGTTLGESESPPPLVRKARPGDSSVMGAVYRRFVAEEKVKEVERDDQVERQTHPHTRSTDGPVSSGDYLLVVVLGPMQVKAVGESAITAGMRLTAAADGGVRPLQTRTVEGMVVSEGAPVIGVAMGPAHDGLVWVLVNPQ